jgi:chromosome segregation ATPase
VPAGADDRGDGARDGLVERVDGIASWINDLDSRLRATELATSDEKTAKELRRAIEALAKHDPKLEKRLIDRVDVLADRLATLGSTVSTTAAALARKDGEIAALRKSVEDESKRVEALAREHGKGAGAEEIERLRTAVRAVQSERPARVSDSRVEGLGGRIDNLTERVDTLARTVATTAAGLAGRDGDIATLRQRLDEGSARVEQTAAEVRRMQGDGALAHRLDALQAALDEATASFENRESDVAAVRARIDEAYSRVGTVIAGIQSSITTLTSQVDVLDALPAATETAIESRSAELNGRVDEIAGQLLSLAKSLESATSSLDERRAEVAMLNTRADEASTRLDEVVDELRQTLAQLPEPGTIDPAVESRLAALAGSVGEVTTQLVELTAASSAQAERASARAVALEGSLSLVGERLSALEEERDRAAALLEAAGAAWSEEREWVRSRLEALADADADAAKTSDGVRPVVEALTARLDAMEMDRAAAASEIARMSVALDAERQRLNAQLEGLASALAEATAPTGRDEESERMLGELAARLERMEQGGLTASSEIARVAAAFEAERQELRTQLIGLSTAFAEAQAAGASDDTEQKLGELAARLERMEQGGLTASSEIARVAAAFEAERQELRTRLIGLSAALADATSQTDDTAAASSELVNALAARVATVEAHGAAVASEFSRAAAAWGSELEAIDARFAQVTTASTEGGGAAEAAGERLLAELGERVAAMERDRPAVAAEIARATGAWQAERASLEGRLDEVASRLTSAEAEPPSMSPETSEDEVAQLRVAIDGLRMRLASNEQELATLVGTRDTTTRLDELTRRLESLERAPVVVAGRGEGATLTGDGRFRLELRALELRMEHAEAAARENREAVLVQLERLAARIEWRFKRLEEEYESRQPQAVGGQVVPLRPEV